MSNPAPLLGDVALLLLGFSADRACGSDALGWRKIWDFFFRSCQGGFRGGREGRGGGRAALWSRSGEHEGCSEQAGSESRGGGCYPCLQQENWRVKKLCHQGQTEKRVGDRARAESWFTSFVWFIAVPFLPASCFHTVYHVGWCESYDVARWELACGFIALLNSMSLWGICSIKCKIIIGAA